MTVATAVLKEVGQIEGQLLGRGDLVVPAHDLSQRHLGLGCREVHNLSLVFH
jgi:hypothetical protein